MINGTIRALIGYKYIDYEYICVSICSLRRLYKNNYIGVNMFKKYGNKIDNTTKTLQQLCFNGCTHFTSYGTTIAIHFDDSNTLFVNNKKYSATTSKHLNMVKKHVLDQQADMQVIAVTPDELNTHELLKRSSF